MFLITGITLHVKFT